MVKVFIYGANISPVTTVYLALSPQEFCCLMEEEGKLSENNNK